MYNASRFILFRRVSSLMENIFTFIFTFEFLLKVLARGFLFHPFSYLRNGWNILDFTVLVLDYVRMAMEIMSFTAFRSLRLIRVLKMSTLVPGLRTATTGVFRATKNLRDAMILLLFMLSVLALIGLHVRAIYTGKYFSDYRLCLSDTLSFKCICWLVL